MRNRPDAHLLKKLAVALDVHFGEVHACLATGLAELSSSVLEPRLDSLRSLAQSRAELQHNQRVGLGRGQQLRELRFACHILQIQMRGRAEKGSRGTECLVRGGRANVLRERQQLHVFLHDDRPCRRWSRRARRGMREEDRLNDREHVPNPTWGHVLSVATAAPP